jgi:hypothetical protein
MAASAPRRDVEFEPQKTKVEVYNGAEADIPNTLKLLEQIFGVAAEPVDDPKVRAQVIVTTAPTTPQLTPAPGA